MVELKVGKLPDSTSRPIDQVNIIAAMSMQQWLRSHGKAVKPKLTAQQRAELQECFELMDGDGSGAIDGSELGAAFKLLGIHVSRKEIDEMLDEVDRDGSGEVEYPEFVEIMTISLAKLQAQKEEEGIEMQAGLPFHLMATAYRRKRLMEGLQDREMTAQMASMQDMKETEEKLRQQQQTDDREALATLSDAKARGANNDKNGYHTDPVLTMCSKYLAGVDLDRVVFGQEEMKLVESLLPKNLRTLATQQTPQTSQTQTQTKSLAQPQSKSQTQAQRKQPDPHYDAHYDAHQLSLPPVSPTAGCQKGFDKEIDLLVQVSNVRNALRKQQLLTLKMAAKADEGAIASNKPLSV